MKHEESTYRTKAALAASLKKYMTRKPLRKITVSEIIRDCDVNRKTFYYHFEDIYALLKWMLEQEAVEVIKKFDFLVDYEAAMAFVLEYITSNAHMLNCVYDSMGAEEMKKFIYNDFVDLARSVVDGTEQELGLSVDEDYKIFLSNFLTESVAALMINNIKNQQVISNEKVVSFLSALTTIIIPEMLKNEPK